jgi:hypothetical protein
VLGLPPQAFTVRGNRYVSDTLPMAVTPLTLSPAEVSAAQRSAERAMQASRAGSSSK